MSIKYIGRPQQHEDCIFKTQMMTLRDQDELNISRRSDVKLINIEACLFSSTGVWLYIPLAKYHSSFHGLVVVHWSG